MATLEAKHPCQGACRTRADGHRGVVRNVLVSGGAKPFDTPTAFRYCEEAVEEDRRNGFTVEYADDRVTHVFS